MGHELFADGELIIAFFMFKGCHVENSKVNVLTDIVANKIELNPKPKTIVIGCSVIQGIGNGPFKHQKILILFFKREAQGMLLTKMLLILSLEKSQLQVLTLYGKDLVWG